MKINKLLLPLVALAAAVPVFPASAARINNGVTIRATDGTAVNAHGGGVLYEDGYYYWFGENRKGMASNGVSVYRSADLVTWENLGLALTPSGERKNTLQDVAPGRTIERPKVVYNAATGKYVMWAHWEDGNDYTKARVMVATADRIAGPYTLVRTMRPNGQESRDQTVFLDLDGNAYHFRSSEDNMTLQCSKLSPDFLTPLDDFIRAIPGKQYEAPAIMRINETYIGFFSGCTGWRPNPGHMCMTRNITTDSWNDLGNPCIDAKAETTYDSQPTFALKIEGYDYAYMYMGDRWNSSNVETSTYVWLPVCLRTGTPFLRWYSSWDTSLFETMDAIRRAARIEDNGSYVLLSRVADRMVSANGNAICTYEDDDSRNLSFVFEPAGDEAEYRLRNEADGRYLQGAGTVLSLADASDADTQVWRFDRQSDNFYIISNKSTGRVLSVKDGLMSSGAPIELIGSTSASKARFGVYFDKRKHDYEEDNPFGKPYAGESGIGSVRPAADDVIVSCNGGHISVTLDRRADDAATKISVYDLSGRCVVSFEARSRDGYIDVELPPVADGVYILAVDSYVRTTAKIAVRR